MCRYYKDGGCILFYIYIKLSNRSCVLVLVCVVDDGQLLICRKLDLVAVVVHTRVKCAVETYTYIYIKRRYIADHCGQSACRLYYIILLDFHTFRPIHIPPHFCQLTLLKSFRMQICKIYIF